MKLCFRDVENTEHDLHLLYQLLLERDETINISHRQMPSFEEHRRFVESKPYRLWKIVLHKETPVGAIYLSHQCEIGSFLLKAHHNQGLGTEMISQFLELVRPFAKRVYANINPRNDRSIHVYCDKLGFSHLQNTYTKTLDGS